MATVDEIDGFVEPLRCADLPWLGVMIGAGVSLLLWTAISVSAWAFLHS